ncbi:hypothetical protein D9758_011610 [Tetrapyrgos nigripes]|uniref:NB-ARC domain-containing protein n=1 Tax=Tetrapyrgos nigripes TaxID=182062 RepID=A0A8H5CSZ5_9AGAR|nr:hypothetical protein D9758_011610 [Tetrapyrgos nigripes]
MKARLRKVFSRKKKAKEVPDVETIDDGPNQTGTRNQGIFFPGAHHMNIVESTVNNRVGDNITIKSEITADDLRLQTPQVPAVFTGRSKLVEEAVNILCGTNQVHIGILGAGGIGKTSVALHIMEDPLIKEKFAERCYFHPL